MLRAENVITNKRALEIIQAHYNNTHDTCGISLITFYAECGAFPTYNRFTIKNWLLINK